MPTLNPVSVDTQTLSSAAASAETFTVESQDSQTLSSTEAAPSYVLYPGAATFPGTTTYPGKSGEQLEDASSDSQTLSPA